MGMNSTARTSSAKLTALPPVIFTASSRTRRPRRTCPRRRSRRDQREEASEHHQEEAVDRSDVELQASGRRERRSSPRAPRHPQSRVRAERRPARSSSTEAVATGFTLTTSPRRRGRPRSRSAIAATIPPPTSSAADPRGCGTRRRAGHSGEGEDAEQPGQDDRIEQPLGDKIAPPISRLRAGDRSARRTRAQFAATRGQDRVSHVADPVRARTHRPRGARRPSGAAARASATPARPWRALDQDRDAELCQRLGRRREMRGCLLVQRPPYEAEDRDGGVSLRQASACRTNAACRAR